MKKASGYERGLLVRRKNDRERCVQMARRGGNRLVYQTEQALKEIQQFDRSKREARAMGEKRIHSVATMEKALSVSQNFVKWAKDQGVKDLYQLKRAHYKNYIEQKQSEGVSTGHLINIETNLRLLGEGMKQISAAKGNQERVWIPKQRVIKVAEREKPVDRSLKEDRLHEVKERLSENGKEAALLQEAFGLRVRELANATTHYIQERDGRLYWVADSTKGALNASQGVTKAGRSRIAMCNPLKAPEVRQMLQKRSPGDYLTKIKYNSIRSAYKRAGVEGTHTFRHNYAREMMRQGLENRGFDVDRARDMLKAYREIKDSGNNSRKMQELKQQEGFKELQICMNEVHGYLGHGADRMDLAHVYLEGF